MHGRGAVEEEKPKRRWIEETGINSAMRNRRCEGGKDKTEADAAGGESMSREWRRESVTSP